MPQDIVSRGEFWGFVDEHGVVHQWSGKRTPEEEPCGFEPRGQQPTIPGPWWFEGDQAARYYNTNKWDTWLLMEREAKAAVRAAELRYRAELARLEYIQLRIREHRDYVPPSPHLWIKAPENEQAPSTTVIKRRRSAVTVLSAEADW